MQIYGLFSEIWSAEGGDPKLSAFLCAGLSCGIWPRRKIRNCFRTFIMGKRRLTVVFDRGGYSPKLLHQIIAANFDLLRPPFASVRPCIRPGRRRTAARKWLLDRSGLPVARDVSSVDKTISREGRIVGSGDLRLFQHGKNQPKH